MTIQKKKALRRMIELAYMHAWGVEGNEDLRDQFRIDMHNFYKDAGNFASLGNGSFVWDDPKEMGFKNFK